MTNRDFFQRRFSLPGEHGSWIWWIGPYCIGIAAAGHISRQHLSLFIAMLAAFLFRQPLTIYIKTLSNRRAKRDRLPALLWSSIYATIALLACTRLLNAGFGRLLWLLLPGIPVFLWQLYLISRRAERGQRGVEIVGAGVLALAAPASFWVAGGTSIPIPWTLWAITWLQSAASIVLVYQRLHERRLDSGGSLPERFARTRRSLAYHSFNLGFSLLAVLSVGMPWLLLVASGLMMLDALDTLRAPAVGWKPVRIGLRQLLASSMFMLLVAVGFLLEG
jgi:hypothetical protein